MDWLSFPTAAAVEEVEWIDYQICEAARHCGCVEFRHPRGWIHAHPPTSKGGSLIRLRCRRRCGDVHGGDCDPTMTLAVSSWNRLLLLLHGDRFQLESFPPEKSTDCINLQWYPGNSHESKLCSLSCICLRLMLIDWGQSCPFYARNCNALCVLALCI